MTRRPWVFPQGGSYTQPGEASGGILAPTEIPPIGAFPGYLKSGNRVDFNPDAFEKFVSEKGIPFNWARAGSCPCLNDAQTGQSDPMCSLCDGDGWFYFNPLVETDPAGNGDFTEIPAVFYNVKSDPSIHERFGEWWAGTAGVTTLAKHRLSLLDRLWTDTQLIPFDEVLVRDLASGNTVGVGRKDTKLRYPIRRALHVRSLSTVFRHGVDYTLDNGSLIWTPGKGPNDGERYTVAYECNPVWRVVDHTFQVQMTQTQRKSASVGAAWLPVTALVKLEYLVVSKEPT